MHSCDPMPPERYIARIEELRMAYAFKDTFLYQNLTIKEWREEAFDHTVLQLCYRLAAAETTEETHKVEYPANWWQHFKHNCFPEFAERYEPESVSRLSLNFNALQPE